MKNPQPQQEYIRPELMAFAEAMETTLRKHDNKKTGWRDSSVSFGYLFNKVKEEYSEAYEQWDIPMSDYARTAEELIDVANFCMMFWDKYYPSKADAIRSCPHTSTPGYPVYICPYCETHENNRFACSLSEIHSSCNYLVKENRCLIKNNSAAIRNATLDTMVEYHKEMITRLHTPKNGAVSIVSIRSAVIQHEKSITKIESLRTQQEHP